MLVDVLVCKFPALQESRVDFDWIGIGSVVKTSGFL